MEMTTRFEPAHVMFALVPKLVPKLVPYYVCLIYASFPPWLCLCINIMHYYATRAALLVPDITTFFSFIFPVYPYSSHLSRSYPVFCKYYPRTITALADPRLETGYLAA